MTLPDDRRKSSPQQRFREILSAEQDDEPAREGRKPAVVNLPRVGEQAALPAAAPAAPGKKGGGRSDRATGSRVLPTFWSIGAILSIIANVVLLGMVLRGASPGSGSAALPGVYRSLELLDTSHIRTTVPLQTSLTLDASVPIKTATRITLAQDLLVRDAHVTISGSGLSIDSAAAITLPAGTELDVNLDLQMPLQSALPISAQVPVDISIRDTELHDGIRGVLEALRPLVCASAPAATSTDGTRICP